MENIYPYYDARKEYYDELTEGMSDKAKRGFANALAHHMMPIQRNKHGWWMTRFDFIIDTRDRPKTSLVDNDGKWHYYKEFEK